MSENEKIIPCADGCHSATDAHVFMNVTDAKSSDSACELPPMPAMQQCDGICSGIYPTDQLTKFPCQHFLCGMCLNECSLIERNGEFLCPMRECKYISSVALRMNQQPAATFSNRNSDEERKKKTPEAKFLDSNFLSAISVAKSHTSKLSESESNEDGMDND